MKDELRPECDLKKLRVRRLGPDVAEVFPDAESVNEALRFLIRETKENKLALNAPDSDA